MVQDQKSAIGFEGMSDVAAGELISSLALRGLDVEALKGCTRLEIARTFSSVGLSVSSAYFLRESGGCSCNRSDCDNPGAHPISSGLKDPWRFDTRPEVLTASWASKPNASIAFLLRFPSQSHSRKFTFDGKVFREYRDVIRMSR